MNPSIVDREHLNSLIEGGPYEGIEEAMGSEKANVWGQLFLLHNAMLVGATVVAAGGDALYFQGADGNAHRLDSGDVSRSDELLAMPVELTTGQLAAEWLLAYNDEGGLYVR